MRRRRRHTGHRLGTPIGCDELGLSVLWSRLMHQANESAFCPHTKY